MINQSLFKFEEALTFSFLIPYFLFMAGYHITQKLVLPESHFKLILAQATRTIHLKPFPFIHIKLIMKKLLFILFSAFFIGQNIQAQTCACNPNGWQPFTAIINKTTQTVNCGHQFGVPKEKPFKLVGKYLCKDTCTAKYSAVLKNNVTRAVVQNYPVFTFPWTYTFLEAGNYKLEITPICGGKRCQPCVFYLTVN